MERPRTNMSLRGHMHAGRGASVHGSVGCGKGSALIPELQEYVHATQQKSEPSNGGSQGGRMDIYEEY